VVIDDASAIVLAVQRLVAIGRRRILCLAGQPNWLISQRRLQGYRLGLAQCGLAADDALVMFGDFTRAGGERVAREAIASGQRFDAVLAFNDYTAVGAMQVLREAGMRVPDDVAVIGCDDTELATLVSPQLTSVSFPQYEFGRTAARMLLQGGDEQTASFTGTLVERDSTANTAKITT
jgi:LacI family transcriptional regulator